MASTSSFARWWSDLAHDLRLYRHFAAAQVRGQLQYRASFLLNVLAQFLATGSELAALVLLLAQFGDLAGWRAGEVALLYALSAIAFGLTDLSAAGFDAFHHLVRRGEFDRVLLRPASVFGQVLVADVQLRRIGRVLQGVAALTLSLAWTPIAWDALKIGYVIVAVLAGVVMYASLMVFGAVICFWTVESVEIINVLTYGGTTLTSYPLSIYSEPLQRVFLFVVPLAFISYIPGLYVLDRLATSGLPAWIPLLTPVAAAVMAVGAWSAWRVGVRHYQSTGS